MRFTPLKIGELARRTGLTVRTLHHYDAIGLLCPSLHTEAGHRLYSAADVARLHQVLSLRQLGFALEEIRGCLDAPDFAPLDLLHRHIDRLRQEMALAQQLCTRLEGLVAYFRSAGEVPAEEFLHTMEMMTMIENLYTPEQRKQFSEIAQQVNPGDIRAVETGWTALLGEIRAIRDRDPAGPEAQALLVRWEELHERTMAFYQGHPELKQAIADNYKQGRFEGFELAPQAADFAFIERAKAARK